MAINTGDNLFTEAKWIVDATAGSGTHTTIASAITSASSGDTIFIRPGTYTENPTLKVGVDLVSWPGDGNTGNVIILGNCTLSTAGTVTISGLQLQTNSANCLTISGSVASIVNLNNCYINCTNNTGISFSSSSASAQLNIYNCQGNLGTTGIAYLSDSSAGNTTIIGVNFTNTGASSTASTKSAGKIQVFNSIFTNPITYSSSGTTSGIFNSNFDNSANNTTMLTMSGTGSLTAIASYFSGGTASSLSIGTGTTLTISSCTISSSNTNAITGAGTINAAGIIYSSGSTFLNNATTQTGGTIQGLRAGNAPSAGFLGEQIRSAVASGSVSVTTNTATNVTSISLTAGIWDVSCMLAYTGTITGTVSEASISTTSATRGTIGDNNLQTPFFSTASSAYTLAIPAYRISLSTTTTVYLVAFALYTVGTLTAGGRISATRVG